MSNIEEQILRMKFDNQAFEKNVGTSIRTLEKLKASMNFDGATKSIANIENTINNVDFSKITNSLDVLTKRFSVFGIAGMKIVTDLTGKLENFASRIFNNTIGQIQSGGWARTNKIANAKFAIEGLGYAWDDVSESINKAVDNTAYGLDAAANAASQLLASGVQVGDQMDTALHSISGIAAQTNSSYEEIAHIYTTIAGNGRLMTEQLNMFSIRGMNAAAALAKQLGKTEAEIREMTTKGEIDFMTFATAMEEAFGSHAAEANKTFQGALDNMKAALSRVGQKFAEPIRRDMIPVWNALRLMINDVNKRITPMADAFSDFFDKFTNVFVAFIKNLDFSWVDRLAASFSSMYKSFDKFMKRVTPNWRDVNAANGELSRSAKSLFEVAKKTKDLGKHLKKVTELVKKAQDPANAIKMTAEDFVKVGDRLIGDFKKANNFAKALGNSFSGKFTGLFKKTDDAQKSVKNLNKSISDIYATLNGSKKIDFIENFDASKIDVSKFAKVSDSVQCLRTNAEYLKDTVANFKDGLLSKDAFNKTVDTLDKTITLFERLIGAVERWKQVIADAFSRQGTDGKINQFATILTGIKSAFEIIARVGIVVIDSFLDPFVWVIEGVIDKVVDVAAVTGNWITTFKTLLGLTKEGTDDYDGYSKLHDILSSIFYTIARITRAVIDLSGKSLITLINGVGRVILFLSDFKNNITAIWEQFKKSEAFNAFIKTLKRFKKAYTDFKKKVLDGLSRAFDKFAKMKLSMPNVNFEKFTKPIGKAIDVLSEFFEKVINNVDFEAVWTRVLNVLDKVWKILKPVGEIIGGVFLAAVKALPNILIKVSTVFGKVTDKIKGFIDVIKEAEWFKSIQSSISGLLTSIENGDFEFPELSWEGITTAASDAIEWIKLRFNEFKTWLSEKFDNFDLFGFVKTSYENAKTFIAGLFDFSKNDVSPGYNGMPSDIAAKMEEGNDNPILETIKKWFGAAIEWLGNRAQDIIDAFSRLFGGVEVSGSTLYDETVGSATSGNLPDMSGIQNFINALKGAVEPVANAGATVISVFAEGIGIIAEKVNNTEDFAKKVAIITDAITGIFIVLARLKALKAVTNGFEALSKLFVKMDNIIKSVVGLIDEVKKTVKTSRRLINAASLLALSGAILAVAGAFKILSTITWDQFKVAAAAIAVITGALSVLFIVTSKFSSNGVEGLGKLGEIWTAFKTEIMSLTKSLKRLGTAALLGTLTLALTSLLSWIVKMKDLHFSDVEDQIKIIGAVIAELVGALASINLLSFRKKSFGEFIGMAGFLLSFSLSIQLLAGAFEKLGELDAAAVEQAQKVFGRMSLIIKGIMTFGGGKSATSKGTIIATIALIGAVSLSLYELAKNLTPQQLSDSSKALSLVLAAVTAMLAAVGDFFKTTKQSIGEAENGKSKTGNLASVITILVTVGGLIAEFAAATYLLANSGVDGNEILKMAGSLSLGMAAIGLFLNGLSKFVAAVSLVEGGAGIIKTVASGGLISALILGITGLVAALYDAYPGFKEFMGHVGGGLLDFAHWLGSFIHEFVAGLLGIDFGEIKLPDIDLSTGKIFDPKFQKELLDFGDFVAEFIGKITGITGTEGNGVIALFQTLVAGLAAEAVASIFDGFTGENGIKEFANRLVMFGRGMVYFSRIIDGNINESAVTAAANAGKQLAYLEALIPNTGGKISEWLGDNLIDEFGKRIVTFARGIVYFSRIVDGNVSETAVEAAANSGRMLAELEAMIPNTGGKISAIIGDNKIDEFGKRIVPFARGIVYFSRIVDGNVSEDAVQSAKNAGSMLVELENTVSRSNGIAQILAGDNRLDLFGKRIVTFARGIVYYSRILTEGGIDLFAIARSKWAGMMLSNLENTLPPTDGALHKFLFGEKSLSSFGDGLVAFATSLVRFSGILKGEAAGNVDLNKVLGEFDIEAVTTTIDTMQALVDFAKQFDGDNFKAIDDILYGMSNIELVIVQFFEEVGKKLVTQQATFGAHGKDFADAFLTGFKAQFVGEAAAAGAKLDGGFIKLDKEDAEEQTSGIVEMILTDINKLFDPDGLPAFTTKFTNLFETLVSDTKTLLTKNETIKSFKDAGTGLINALRDGFDAGAEGFNLKASGIINYIIMKYNYTYYNQFYDSGYNFAAGLANGINAGAYLAVDAATLMGDNAVSALNAALDEKSPSRETAKSGKYFTEGFANGIRKCATLAEDASEFVGDKALSTLNGFFLAGEMLDLNPVITPTLDLSQIQNGGRLINGMLSNANSMITANGIKISNAMVGVGEYGDKSMNQQLINQERTEMALNGIRSDLKALGEVMSNMQMILDSGAVVGQLSGKIDEQLGFYQKMKERYA